MNGLCQDRTENVMNNIFLTLVILPAILLICIDDYIKNVKAGMPERQAVRISWVHAITVMFFFAFGYGLRFISDGALF